MNIEIVKEYSRELLDAMNRLLPQLANSHFEIEEYSLRNIINADNSYLFVARSDNNKIVGTLTLVIYAIPTIRKAYIEDVVVDGSQQGNGVGRMLLNEAICFTRGQGVTRVELTSNPSRVAANKLYQSLGFEIRDTNFYRLELE